MKMGFLLRRFSKRQRRDDQEKPRSRRSGQQSSTLPPARWFEEKLKSGVEKIKQRNHEVRQKRKEKREKWRKNKTLQKNSETVKDHVDSEISDLLRGNKNMTFSNISSNEDILLKHDKWMADQKKSLNANETKMRTKQPSNNNWNNFASSANDTKINTIVKAKPTDNSRNNTSSAKEKQVKNNRWNNPNSSNTCDNLDRKPDTKKTELSNSAPETSSWFSNYFQGGVNRDSNHSSKGPHNNDKSDHWIRKAETNNKREIPKKVSDNRWNVKSGNIKNKAEYGNRNKNQNSSSKSAPGWPNQNKAVMSKNWNQSANSSKAVSGKRPVANAGANAANSWINQNNNEGRTVGLRKRFSVKRNRTSENKNRQTPKLRSVSQKNQWKKPQDVEKPSKSEQNKFSAAGKPANQKASWKNKNSKSSQNQAKPKGIRNRFSVKRSLKGKNANASNQRITSSKAVNININQVNKGSKLSRPKTVPSSSSTIKASSIKRKTVPTGSSSANNSSKKNTKSSTAAERAKMWDKTLSERNSAQASNPFSASFKGTAVVNKSDPNYGKPVEGTKSHQRMLDAAAWVEKEVEKLIGVMREKGDKTHQGHEVTFGVLFKTYENISDSLVGILMRAKKRNKVHFEHEGMLLYPQHADVIMIAFH